MTDLILHHYDASPFSEKIRLILGYKKLSWRSVTIPAIMPKPDLTALTGGYRKTPVLQIGCDVYCDTRLIARVLEQRAPQPSIYPRGQEAVAGLTAAWADQELFKAAVATAFQPAGLQQFIAELTQEELEGFGKDRTEFVKDAPNPPGMPLPVVHGHMPSHLGQLDTQLQTVDYLGGAQPCIADFSVYHCLWFFHRRLPAELEPTPNLVAWMTRMEAIGHGTQSPMESSEALSICESSEPLAQKSPLQSDRNGTTLDQQVTVSPIDYGIDPVEGKLVYLAQDEMAVSRQDPRAGELVVHFPRVGFSLRAQ